MYKKRRYKRKQKGKGTLLGSDWPKIRKTLLPYLRKKKQIGKGNCQGYKKSIFW